MMKLSQRYLGVVTADRAKELKDQGYEILRTGSLHQVFGSSHLPPLPKVAFRGEVWKAPRRDTLQLHIDTEKIIKRLIPLLQEEIHGLQDPGVKLNYARKIGHGHSLHVLDQHRNETLDIHVAATPWDQEVWVHWRLTHWTDTGKDIYAEDSVGYPKSGEWDDKKQQDKVVNALLKPIRQWLKGEDRE